MIRPESRVQLTAWIGRALAAAWPFRGKGRLVNALGGMASRFVDQTYAFPRSGARLPVDLRDRIQRYMWGGCFELEVLRALSRLLAPGAVFVDIGAHIGFFTILSAHLVGEAGQVHAFEPDPILFERLRANTSGLPQVKLHELAISGRSGKVIFRRGIPGESGWGTLMDLPGRQCQDVQSMTLDEWVRRNADVSRIDVMKVDAEGSELAILAGGERTLSSWRPRLLLEVNEPLLHHEGTSGEALIHRLQGLDYACQYLETVVGSCGCPTLLCESRDDRGPDELG